MRRATKDKIKLKVRKLLGANKLRAKQLVSYTVKLAYSSLIFTAVFIAVCQVIS